MQFFQTPNIDFISKRKIAFILSGLMFLIGIVSLVLHKGPNYGIDFKGGTSIVIKFDGKVTVRASYRRRIKKGRSSGYFYSPYNDFDLRGMEI